MWSLATIFSQMQTYPGSFLRQTVLVKPHDAPGSWPSATSSMVPTLKNAASGYSSISPSMMALNPRIVSFTGTYLPGTPVKFSATWNGWDKPLDLFWPGLQSAYHPQLLHTQNGNDVLQLLILLKHLHLVCHLIVSFPNHILFRIREVDSRGLQPDKCLLHNLLDNTVVASRCAR